MEYGTAYFYCCQKTGFSFSQSLRFLHVLISIIQYYSLQNYLSFAQKQHFNFNMFFPRLLLLAYILILQQNSCKSEISTATNQFGLKLYSELSKVVDGDFIISPFPISRLFGLLYNALDDKDEIQKTEIINTLQFPGSPQDTSNDFRRVLYDFENLETVENITSQVFLNTSLEINEEQFGDILKQFYINPDTINLSELNESNSAISSWIHKSPNKTSERNETLQLYLKNDKLDPESNLALVAKSFLKGSWVHRFNPLFTKPSPFYYDDRHANLLETMFQRAQVPYAEIRELDATAMALPYRISSKDFSDSETRIELIILLPNSRTGLKDMEERLEKVPFSRIIGQFIDTKDLFIYVPKFQVKTWIDVAPLMIKMGLKTLLSSELGLAKMVQDGENLKLTNVFQFSEMSIDEFGSDGIVSHVPNQFYNYNSPDSFRVNRPFIGFVYDQERHIILNIFRKTI